MLAPLHSHFDIYYIRRVRRIILYSLILNLGLLEIVAQSKLSPNLRSTSEQRFYPNQELIVLVNNRSDFVKDYHERITIRKLTQSSGVILAILPEGEILQELVEDENVRFIDIIRKPVEEAILDEPNLRFNRVRKWQNSHPNFDDLHAKIAIKEQRFDPADIDLLTKFFTVGLEGETQSAHATSMATIIAGRGNSSVRSTGILPSGHLTSSDFDNLLPDDEALLLANEIHIENHSYGVGIENYYGIEAMAYDVSTNKAPTIMHVFSAGNSGSQTPDNGTYSDLPFANLTGTFKQAKNIITVAALDTSLSINEFASRGPAYDGRLKPELTAYGGRGTSDAAAIVSGIAALLQQEYKSSTGSIPNASLIKAILIASADDIGNEGPDFYTGYGSVNANKASKLMTNDWIKELTLTDQNTRILNIEIPVSVHELKLAVSWTDPAAEIDAPTALVNDIDSELSDGMTTYLPWVLNSSANTASLNAKAQRGEDHLNNVEFISIKNPAAGNYALNLHATALTEGSQIVSVAWYYEKKDFFEWDFPNGTDRLMGSMNEKLLWQSTFESASGKLELKMNDSAWQTINKTIDLSLIEKWLVPEQSGKAILKMTIGDTSFVSEEFSIGKQPDIKVSYNCESTFGLSWPPILEAEAYRIYEMGDVDLELVGTTTDSYFTVEKTDKIFYAVSAIKDDYEFRSDAVNYTFQGAFCYINFLSAQQSDYQVKISLDLSTENEVVKIEIFKSYNETSKELVSTIVPDGSLTYSVIDNSADPGLIDYTTELTFEDSSKIISDTASIFVIKPGEAIFFPNPATENYINILSEGNGQILEIIDSKGMLVLEKTLDFKVEYINLKDFLEGLYYYRLMKNGKQIDSGKFIKY